MKIWTAILILSYLVLAVPAPLVSQESGKKPPPDQALVGKKLFLQRCSICHLPRLYQDVEPYGPRLEGYLNKPGAEDRARRAIREGGPRMPGFQYGLQPGEIDEIIAYMKTTKAPAK